MHEVGLASAVVATVLGKARGRRVLGAGIRVGSTHRVGVEALEMGFHHQCEGTAAAGAELEVEVVPATLRCTSCGQVQLVEDPHVACPACHSIEVEVTNEDELTLVWVRYDEAGGSTHS